MTEPIFAKRFREAMEERAMKQVDILRAAQEQNIKLGKSQISQYVSGKSVPRANVGQILAQILQVDIDWLYGKDAAQPIMQQNAPVTAGNEHPAADVADLSSENVTTAAANLSAESAITTVADSSVKKVTDDHTSAENNTGNRIKTIQQTELTSVTETVTDFKTEGKKQTMREFKKSTKLDNVLYDVRGPVVDEANRMEESGVHVLKLNIGNPAPFGFRTPDEVVYDMQQQLTECEGYSPAQGLFAARKAIMQYAQIKHIPNVAIRDIYTGNGVSELINMSMSALLDNGDEVLVPSPDYPLWTACVTLAGGKAVHYICDEQAEWYPDMDDIRKKITPNTKAIVIINPNNPTGALYPREVLQEIVDIAREHQLIIFSDEIYDRLVMDGEEHVSIASLAPDLFCVTFSGLSKSHMIAGYRIGWMVLSGNKSIAEDYIQGLNMLSNMRLCSNVPAQSIVQTALGGHQSVNDYIVPGGRIYEQREFIYNALNDIPGITAVKPKAAFYIFPKIDTKKFNIVNDEKFALDLLKEKKILIIHGGGFNWGEPDHFRVVYLPRIEVLKDATDKLADFLNYYHQ